MAEQTVEEKVEEKVESPSQETEEEEAPSPVRAFQVKARRPEDKLKHLSILVHGDSGTGKTVFAGSMVETGLKLLYIVFNEEELLTLDQKGIQGYDYLVIDNYRKLWPLYLALRKNTPGYEGVVLDGLGDLQQAAKDLELQDGGGTTFKFMENAMMGSTRMYLRNWGNLLEMTRHFLDPFLKLPLHKIITCVSEADDDPKTGGIKVYPGLQGSLQQLISAHFSVVAYSYIAHRGAETHYCLTTHPHEIIATKDRTGLCRVLVTPKFQTFLDALQGKLPPITELQRSLATSLVLRPRTGGPQREREEEAQGRKKSE